MGEPYVTLTAGELTVVVGDNEAGAGELASHREGYNGLWSLRSVHEERNCYVPAFAGLNLEHFMDDLFMTDQGGDMYEPRRIPMRLERLGETAARQSENARAKTEIVARFIFRSLGKSPLSKKPKAVSAPLASRLKRASTPPPRRVRVSAPRLRSRSRRVSLQARGRPFSRAPDATPMFSAVFNKATSGKG